MTSKVFYTTMRTTPGNSVPKKLKKLLLAAGLADFDLDKKMVAIKTHFGEQGNVTHLRPEYTRAVAEQVIALGGRPFATDCSTLYFGMRGDALDHLRCAAMNGFSHDSCGCDIVIADGLRGTDEVDVPVPAGGDLQVAHIGSAIMDADVLITLSHAKGCMATTLGAAIKNIGMGCASRAGKMVQHREGKPFVRQDQCVGCRRCLRSCGQNAIEFVPAEDATADNAAAGNAAAKAYINDNCKGCGHCVSFCPEHAICPGGNDSWNNLQAKMGEYAAAVQCNQKCFHIAIAIDITPGCDCFPESDSPMVPDIGMFASFDPVALDQAVAERILASPVIETAALPEKKAAVLEKTGQAVDHLHAINPDSDWDVSLERAEKLGAGSRSYQLVEV